MDHAEETSKDAPLPAERLEPPSIQAFAVDTGTRTSFEPSSPDDLDNKKDSADVPEEILALSARQRRLGILVGVPLVLCVAILGLAAARDVRHGPSAESARNNPPAKMVVAAIAAPPVIAAPAPVPSSDVNALPPLLPDTASGVPQTTPPPAAGAATKGKAAGTVDGKRVKNALKQKPSRAPASPPSHEPRKPGSKKSGERKAKH